MNYISLKHNNDFKDKWDIEEDEGFEYINGYKVNVLFSPKNNEKVAKLLELIDAYIKELQVCARTINEPYCQLLANTEHYVQEISYNNQLSKFTGNKKDNQKFEGINKPKGIVHHNYGPDCPFRDSMYKCTWRLVMLALRRRSGDKRVRSWKSIKALLLHELAHTMCNHILYYTEENHLEDFDRAEDILKELSKVPNVKNVENEIIRLIINSS